jgi:dienelactone hydrolase
MTHNRTYRAALLKRLRPFPERVPLAAEYGPVQNYHDHTRTLVSYVVEALPGILAIHQHAGQYHLGKSEPAGLSPDPMYHYGLELCRRGYVVLCPDQLCFEDRRPSPENRAANPALADAGYERFVFTQRIMEGSCLQTKYLHDLTCALDLLAGLPDVDARRLGAIGHSLGGQETLWLAWYDARVKAAVSSCGFGLISTLLRDAINHNFALYVPDMLSVCDMDGVLAEVAPRAFLLTAGEADPIFPIDGVRSLAERASAAYQAAGAPDRLRALIFPGGHGMPDNVREEAYMFLDRWLG